VARSAGGSAGAVRRVRLAWRVYILRCGDGSLYTGATNDLPRRLKRHAAGAGARYTRARLPVALVYEEPASDRGAALRREAAIKRTTRADKLGLIRRAARVGLRPTSPQGRGSLPRPMSRVSGTQGRARPEI
jgi:putative endonuclease